MIPLERTADVSTYERGEYALAVFPTMYRGKVYLTSARVVLVENVSILGDIQRYILPGQRSSCKPNHLCVIRKIPKLSQRRAGEWFQSVLFFESLEEAGGALGLDLRDSVSSAASSGAVYSSQEGSSGG